MKLRSGDKLKPEIYLRMFEKEDLPFIHKLRADEANFALTLRVKDFVSLDDSKAWLEHKMRKTENYKYFAICLKDTNKVIGFISLNNIDLINRNAECGGLVIAEEYASQGVGQLTSNLILDYVYGHLGLNLLYLYIQEDNISSQKLGEKLGFKRTGYIPEFSYKNYKYHNVYIYALTRQEYLLINNITLEVEVNSI